MRKSLMILAIIAALGGFSCDSGGGGEPATPGLDTSGGQDSLADGIQDLGTTDGEPRGEDTVLPDTVAVDLLPDELTPDVIPPEDVPPPQDIAPQPCVGDEDCPDGQHCEPVAGLCVDCLFEHQCGVSEHCTDGECVPFSSCTEDLDCPDGLVCAQEISECVHCLTDEQCDPEGSAPYCDPVGHLCALCVEDVHCPEAHECMGGVCLPFDPCESSKDCDEGICWTEAGKCVDCLEQADCDEGTVCADHVCHPFCDSDKDCKDQDGVCDKDLGICVDCVGHEDCLDVYHCLAGACVLDLCASGVQLCQDNKIVACNEVGDSFDLIEACAESQACKQDQDTAACLDMICLPGEPYCDEEGHAIQCSPDGLEILSDEDCDGMDLVCELGACELVICEPGEEACDDLAMDKLVCSPLGTQWLPLACPEKSYCQVDDELGVALCMPQLCDPDQPACLGNTATTCNGNGSGLLAGGEDCGELTCLSGVCSECQETELCDGLDNDCDGVVDNNPTDCGAPGQCFFGACYEPLVGANCWVKLFEGHIYMACYKNATNGLQAAEICEEWHGSHLVVLNDAAEEQFILSNISGPAYIGYTDAAQEGDWIWAFGSSDYENWCPSQPDDWQSGEDCCMMRSNTGGGSNCWNDTACDKADNRFVCEGEGL